MKPSFVKVVEKKEMPTWISESTVRTAEDQVIQEFIGSFRIFVAFQILEPLES